MEERRCICAQGTRHVVVRPASIVLSPDSTLTLGPLRPGYVLGAYCNTHVNKMRESDDFFSDENYDDHPTELFRALETGSTVWERDTVRNYYLNYVVHLLKCFCIDGKVI
jgi:hypothetical protein